MKIQSIVPVFLVLTVFVFAPSLGFAQISSVANEVVPTVYTNPNGTQDFIHIFCGAKGATNASLTATAPNGDSGIFEWMKYNSVTKEFDLPAGNSSAIFNLDDGCYRVKITSTSVVPTDTTFTAWIFNNYIETTAEISNSDCNSFALKGAFDSPTVFKYIDPTTGLEKELDKGIVYKWLDGSTLINRTVDPPAKDTDYTFQVTDKFGCVSKSTVRYISIVTDASFTYTLKVQGEKSDPKVIEAPATFQFTHTFDYGDADQYEWFIFKDLQKIKDEIEAKTFKDSIQKIIYSENPIYTFDEVGTYKVKLVSKKVSPSTTCTDTVYIDDFIIVEESIIEAPNFFTPGNGDGANDEFVVKFFSMKSVKISIFNRWGKVLHVYENNNVQGFYNTKATIPESVWNGKVGGRLATPGVYYYVVEGIGRDDKRRRAKGFFHLFRDK